MPAAAARPSNPFMHARPLILLATLTIGACGAGFETADDETTGRVVTTETEIEIIEAVKFADGEAVIPDSGHKMLDAIAATLAGNPGITKMQVQASADTLELADMRADAVIDALIDRGVAAERLVPSATTTRVSDAAGDLEFLILERAPATGGSCGG